jgi:hypothetical protein
LFSVCFSSLCRRSGAAFSPALGGVAAGAWSCGAFGPRRAPGKHKACQRRRDELLTFMLMPLIGKSGAPAREFIAD